ncbi:MAG TPA: radical SAM family heme chaperone HemW [Bacteroidia bacterium]|jgi:oxygen-independent coproporphyrinogen-3 oxidase|nr:radical SAM family heme chaperone HemW [Bacteroidia bacterium]
MPGIYIHIPYCKQACHYCDFYFSTSLQTKPLLLDALVSEMRLRKDYLGGKVVQTVYLGGGTPSLLSGEELNRLFEELQQHFVLAQDAEITMEVNPDDLDLTRLKSLAGSPVNRLSIGIQSFRDEDLKRMNRAHDSAQALSCVKRAQDAGFSNISIDLIYGLPDLSNEDWRSNLQKAFALEVQHISSYCLTVEPKTAWAKQLREGLVPAVDEEGSSAHFRIMKEEMNWNGFIQYEISNFGKEHFFSKHNSNYWKGEHYLGLGPSAHSFNGLSRQWNIANNNAYIRAMSVGVSDGEKEILSEQQKYNEYVMTSLRTIWGCDLDYVRRMFGEKIYGHCSDESEFYLNSGKLVRKGNLLLLSDEGMLVADRIASDLFSV